MSDRMLATIMNDPQASEEELRKLANEHPPMALAHPNCPIDVWWSLAQRFPIEALRSPLYELNTLEEPERWLAMEKERRWRWVKEQYRALSSTDLRLWLADCVAHVLYVFESALPGDTRPRQAIEATRQYARGQLSDEALIAASEEIRKSEPRMEATKVKPGVWQVADAALHASHPNATQGQGYEAVINAASLAAANAAGNNAPENKTANERYGLESLWQWRRMVEYLLGKVGSNDVIGARAKKTAKHRVGARSPQEIVDDPQATPGELTWAAVARPWDVVQHPNCDTEMYWKLAVNYPIFAMRSPLYELLTLESPERWIELEKDDVEKWIRVHRDELSDTNKRLFAADLATRVLPIWEEAHPLVDIPRKAIQAVRDYVQGRCTKDDLQEAHDNAAFLRTKDRYAWNDNLLCVRHAAHAAEVASRFDFVRFPLSLAGLLNVTADAMSLQYSTPHIQEKIWQWRLMAQYLIAQAEHDEGN